MGLSSMLSSTSSQSPSEDSNPEGAAPGRSQRARCWAARDAFFACLDANGIVDSLKHKDQADAKCHSEDVVLQKDCASSWVEYFKKRRVMEHQRNETIEKLKNEGAQSMPAPPPPGATGSTAR
ncbi:MAG: hypothetical protein M4579_006635 [Chaenotheca gracillima]|nr:MAG: hypothetical protein M4579_006635 [Chaenotheca gracillima]